MKDSLICAFFFSFFFKPIFVRLKQRKFSPITWKFFIVSYRTYSIWKKLLKNIKCVNYINSDSKWTLQTNLIGNLVQKTFARWYGDTMVDPQCWKVKILLLQQKNQIDLIYIILFQQWNILVWLQLQENCCLVSLSFLITLNKDIKLFKKYLLFCT